MGTQSEGSVGSVSEDLAEAISTINHNVMMSDRVRVPEGEPHRYAFQLTHEQWKAVRDRLAYADVLEIQAWRRLRDNASSLT